MGIIAKQSIKGSFYIYAGAVLGFINTGLLMPKFFATNQVGLINLLIAITIIFSQFGNLGFTGVITRLFPYFRDKQKKHNGILTFGIIVSSIGFFIVLILFFLLRDYLIHSNAGKSNLLAANINYIPVLSFFFIFFTLFDNYNKVLLDAVLGIFLREFLVRLLNLLIILLFVFNYINFSSFILAYTVIFSLPTLILVFVLVKRKVFYFGKINKEILIELKPEILKTAGFWIIAGFTSTAVQAIDKYMINYYLGLGAVGIYSVTFYFGVLVSMPSRAINKISSIIVSESWKRNDLKTIADIYKKSSLNMFIIGILLVVGIWANIDNIFEIIPKYIEGKYVILFSSLLNLLNMSSGISSVIIANSKYYRINAYIMIITLVNIVISNIIFINLWGLKGAAFASLLSITISIFLRLIFLYKKFKLQPYSFAHLKIIVISAFVFFINLYLPKMHTFYIDILIRSSLITVVFACLIFFSNVSEDANNLVYMVFQKIKNIIAHKHK